MHTKKIDFAKEKENIIGLVKNLFNNFEGYIPEHSEWRCLNSIESLDGTLVLKHFKDNKKYRNGDIYINIDEITSLLRIYYIFDICIFDDFELICRLNNQLRVHKKRTNIYVDKENKVIIERFCDLSGLLFNRSYENQDKFSKEESNDIIKRIEYFLKDKHIDNIIRIISNYINKDSIDEACDELGKVLQNL
ncbi:MAG: hypothetical protein E7401_03220 [Ruminococcaceae bacterium]|nr:hypothetical protein [Oscillospiraceae bacterium]